MKFFLSLAFCIAAAAASAIQVQNPIGLSGLSGLSVLPAQQIGLNQIGLNRIGLRQIGLNQIGLNPISLNQIGLNPISLNQIGLNQLGLDGLGSLGGLRTISSPSIGLSQVPIGIRLVSVPIGVSNLGLNSGLGLQQGLLGGINSGLVGNNLIGLSGLQGLSGISGLTDLSGLSGLDGLGLKKKK